MKQNKKKCKNGLMVGFETSDRLSLITLKMIPAIAPCWSVSCCPGGRDTACWICWRSGLPGFSPNERIIASIIWEAVLFNSWSLSKPMSCGRSFGGNWYCLRRMMFLSSSPAKFRTAKTSLSGRGKLKWFFIWKFWSRKISDSSAGKFWFCFSLLYS